MKKSKRIGYWIGNSKKSWDLKLCCVICVLGYVGDDGGGNGMRGW